MQPGNSRDLELVLGLIILLMFSSLAGARDSSVPLNPREPATVIIKPKLEPEFRPGDPGRTETSNPSAPRPEATTKPIPTLPQVNPPTPNSVPLAPITVKIPPSPPATPKQTITPEPQSSKPIITVPVQSPPSSIGGGAALLSRSLPLPSRSSLSVLDNKTIVSGEILAITGDMPEALLLAQDLVAQGLSVIRRQSLGGLGFVISVFRLPRGIQVAQLLPQLRRLFPQYWLDANHRYTLLGRRGDPRRYAQNLIGWNSSMVGCGSGLRIGLVDSAVDIQHPALRGRQVVTRSLLSAGITPAPSNHGTAIAGLLVGNVGDGLFSGLVPEATLYAAIVFRKVDHKRNDTTAELVTVALNWLLEQKVQVINMSLGGPHNLILEEAVRRTLKQGVGVVAAAGNSGPRAPAVYPAAQSGVLAVTAVDAELKSYRKANRGDYIFAAAPGVDVWVAKPGGGGAYASGSSYAAPFVTAVIGLRHIMQSSIPWLQLSQNLARELRDLGAPGRDQVFGWGLVQLDGCAR